MLPEPTGATDTNVNGRKNTVINLQAERIKRGITNGGTGNFYNSLGEKDTSTGEEIYEIKQRVQTLEDTISNLQKITDKEKATPENIYRIIGTSTSEWITNENVIVKIRELLREGLQNLEQALQYANDEIERESAVDLFFDKIRRISFFSPESSNFEDAITAILVALQGNVANSYSRGQILSLKDIVELLFDNIFMSEEVLDSCISAIENAGFDLSSPFKGIDFNELR